MYDINVKVRINKITLRDFKSVKNGTININASDCLHQEKASITGIYGQNGSGKTVIIEALDIIKHIMCGEKIPNEYLSIIAYGKNECHIEVEFIVSTSVTDCVVIYKCILAGRDDPNTNSFIKDSLKAKSNITIIEECLSARGSAFGEKIILQDIASTNEKCALMEPSSKIRVLFGYDKEVIRKLEKQKILALYGSRSFIFSVQALEAFDLKNNQNWAQILILSLMIYANTKLVTISSPKYDKYMLNFFKQTSKGFMRPYCLEFDIINDSEKAFIPEQDFPIFEQILSSLNIVLSSIIPGLTIKMEYETQTQHDNTKAYHIELFSHREELGTFPFRYESLGIKRIVSFLSCLISAYNDPSFTLVIDEMDSNIFEHLLGVMLDIMKNSGKGQLIFTSHNLRPLEGLDGNSVFFTTTDNENQYVQMAKKGTNNLRDMYLRAISLGYKDIELYNGDSENAISYAFRQAGRIE